MRKEIQIFGMHKAGTSFLMKALNHFCHKNDIALATSAFGCIPLQAYDAWSDVTKGKDFSHYFSDESVQWDKFRTFSKNDFKVKDLLHDRLSRLKIYSTGDSSCEKHISFYRNSSTNVFKMNNAIPSYRIIRNPMSIVKSAYFSHRNTHKTHGWSRLERQRALLMSISQSEGMWETYKFLKSELFFHFTEGPLLTLSKWPEELEDLKTIRMEDMTSSPTSFLLSLWHDLGGNIDNFNFVPPEILTFEHQSGGRKLGEVDSGNHLRSGDPEEWRNLLPPDLIETIRHDYTSLLEKYYPSVLSETYSEPEITPSHTLKELETTYALLIDENKRSLNAKKTSDHYKDRFEDMKSKRDKAIQSGNERFEDMKAQRDKAIQSGNERLEDMKTQRDKAIQSGNERLKDMKAQRDKALEALNNQGNIQSNNKTSLSDHTNNSV
jgi:hypothetical protein